MQWHDATVGRKDPTGFKAVGFKPQQKPGLGQVRVGFVGQASQVRQVSGADQSAVAGAATALPIGLDLPCTEHPELFFADGLREVDQAKAMCRGCRARIACLAGAIERREPWGVWGGELLVRGTIVPHKRPRGRPRKTDVAA
jgi:WhiB family redox-sensing transcriptional regulator